MRTEDRQHQPEEFFCFSFNVPSDRIRCSGELSERPAQQEACVISFSDFFKVYIKPSSITLLDLTEKEVVFFFLVFSDTKSRKYEENWEH